jgi:hypothetical protein
MPAAAAITILLAAVVAGAPPAAAPGASPAARAEDPAGDPYAGLRIFVGDIHVHTGLALYQVLDPNNLHSIGTPDQVLDAAESRGLDFVVITEHTNNLDDPRGVRWREATGNVFTLPDGTTTASEWAYLQSAVARRTRPGRFLVFLGLEYTHGETETGRPGHQAAVFPGDALPRYCSNFPHNAGDCPDHADFFRFVKEQGGVAVMAHPCADWGISDWSAYDPVVNAVELVAGKCEFAKNGYNDALKRGFRVGARGSSDSHRFEVGSSNKTICWARELTREAILDAMRANLCYYADQYPVTLRFSVNGVPMGGEVAAGGAGLAVRAEAATAWETHLDHMELIRNGKVIERRDCEDGEYDACALSVFLTKSVPGYYYVGLSNDTDLRIAVSSPIWVRPSR